MDEILLFLQDIDTGMEFELWAGPEACLLDLHIQYAWECQSNAPIPIDRPMEETGLVFGDRLLVIIGKEN